MSLDALRDWLATGGLRLLVAALIVFLIYRFASPAIHRLVVSLLRFQQTALPAGSAPAEELTKRAATLEMVIRRLLRAAVVLVIVIIVFDALGLWPLLAGFGIIGAAITLAGQAIVLDYLTGILILIEGPYFQGDWIRVPGPGGWVEGEVEEIGLRRTVLRDRSGVVHAIGNGLIRQSSNLTRVYSVAGTEVQILRTQDVDRALADASRVALDLQRDPDWSGYVMEGPVETWVTALTVDGAIVRVQIRVLPTAWWALAAELRKRLAATLAADGIGAGRWDIPVPSDAPPADKDLVEPEDGAQPDDAAKPAARVNR
jgi:moderate conductance mechanosensitive channel